MAPDKATLKLPARQKKDLYPWRLVRIGVQASALVGFIVLFVMTKRGGWSGSLVNFPLRLSPLTMLAQMLASRTFLAGSSLFLFLVILTLVFGRAWCGWLCPMGTILDLFSFKNSRILKSSPPENWRKAKYGVLLVILVAALLGNLTLLVLDPLTILFRTFSTVIWPALDWIVTTLETALYQIPVLNDPISALDNILRPTLLPAEPVYYRNIFVFAAVFTTIIALNLFAERFWCRYLCPLGGLLGLVSKVAIFRRVVSDECKNCGLCNRVCPTGTINPEKHFSSDPAECTMCLECIPACKRDSLVFMPKFAIAERQDYDPGRRELLASLLIGIPLAGIFGSDALVKTPYPTRIRPPGVSEQELLSKCIRCGVCIRTCPTSGLQPAVFEAGLSGLWTPVLAPRLGYCDYACNSCGQACPVQAIPPLSLVEKRLQVIGKAYIDKNRCIAWADNRNCIVCEEMCPLPDKAIKLSQEQVTRPDGEIVQIKLPQVNRDTCIGCGICEYKCPVSGAAAIQIYTYSPSST
ncbi:MAG TPA: 4Fe-4S binding protein [Anaerolineaceae bacterium]|nr:4Fe-4S binding protein [Anaerolineaceae bacterium]